MIEKWVEDWVVIMATDLINGNLAMSESALRNLVAYSIETEELSKMVAKTRESLPDLFYKPRSEIYAALAGVRFAAIAAGPNALAKTTLVN